jgi:type II secretory pathway pseudopilin PulG
MKHIARVALAVIVAMIALPFMPGITDRQINIILGAVAIVCIVGAVAATVWQDRIERAEDRENGGQS